MLHLENILIYHFIFKKRYVLIITDDCDNITFINCTKIESEDDKNILNFSIYTIPSSVLFFSLISLMIYTLNKPLIPNI